MKRAIQSPIGLVVVSISVPLMMLVLMANHYQLFEPGSATLFAVGLVSLVLARR